MTQNSDLYRPGDRSSEGEIYERFDVLPFLLSGRFYENPEDAYSSPEFRRSVQEFVSRTFKGKYSVKSSDEGYPIGTLVMKNEQLMDVFGIDSPTFYNRTLVQHLNERVVKTDLGTLSFKATRGGNCRVNWTVNGNGKQE